MVKTPAKHVQHLSRMTYHSYQVRCPPKNPKESEDLHGTYITSGLPKSWVFWKKPQAGSSTVQFGSPEQRTTRSSLWKLSTLGKVPRFVSFSHCYSFPVWLGYSLDDAKNGFGTFVRKWIWNIGSTNLGFFATLKVTQNDEKWLNSCQPAPPGIKPPFGLTNYNHNLEKRRRPKWANNATQVDLSMEKKSVYKYVYTQNQYIYIIV